MDDSNCNVTPLQQPRGFSKMAEGSDKDGDDSQKIVDLDDEAVEENGVESDGEFSDPEGYVDEVSDDGEFVFGL